MLKIAQLISRKKMLESELEEKRSRRIEVNKRINELADQIAAVTNSTPAAQRRSIEKDSADLADEKKSIDNEIDSLMDKIESVNNQIAESELNQENILSAPGAKQDNKDTRSKKYGAREYRSNERIYNEREYTFEERSLDIGKCIRGMYTGDWKDADLEKRAISTGSANSIIPAPIATKLIDLVRDTSVFTQSNVPTVMMETNTLKFARLEKDMSVGFKEEGKAAAASDAMELGSVELKAKTVYGYAYVSIEALESADNLASIIYSSFSNSIAQAIDKGFLYGEFSEEGEALNYAPSGIYNDPHVLSFNATGSNYDDVIKAIGMIRRNNGNPTAMAYNAATEEIFSTLKDTTGQYLSVPKPVTELKAVVSNQLAIDENGGSDIIVFDPNALVIGSLMSIRLKMSENDTICIENGMVCFRVAAMVDCVVTQPKHICIIKGFGASGE